MSNFFSNLADSASGGLFGAATSLLGNAINNSNANKMLDKQNAFTEKMWNKTNEYNNATNTLQRFIDAGITPGAAVQATTGANGQASQVQSSTQQAPQMNLAQDAIASYNSTLQAEMNEKQKALMDSQITKNNADAGKSVAETKTEDALRDLRVKSQDILNQLNDKQKEQVDATVGKLKAEKKYIDAQSMLTQSQQELLDMQAPLLVAMNRAQIMEIYQHCKQMAAAANASNAQSRYYRAWAGVAGSVIDLNHASANNQNAQAGYTSGALTDNTNARTGLVGSQTTGQDINNDINGSTAGFQKTKIGAESVSSVIGAIDKGYDFGWKVGTDIATGGASGVIRNFKKK